jgi:hypothetical protein
MNDERGERSREQLGEPTRQEQEDTAVGPTPLLAALEIFLDALADEVARRIDESNGDRSYADGGAIDQEPGLASEATAFGLAAAAVTEESPDSRLPATSPKRGTGVGTTFSSLDFDRDGGFIEDSSPDSDAADEPELDDEPLGPAAPPSNAALLMARLAVGILLVVAVINVPYNAQGTALARSIPSSASLVIRNGLLVKESNSTQIWVYRDNAFHWITSLDAFEHYGYRWQDVQMVEPGFVSRYDQGRPLYVLLKCDGSPHIYRLENGQKRWIVDLATFTGSGYVWPDVSSVPCYRLHDLPDRDSIPPGHGAPPPPLP